MVRGPTRLLALLAVGAGLGYLALLARSLVVGSAAWEASLGDWLYFNSERSQAAMDRVLTPAEEGGAFLIALLVVIALFAPRRRLAAILLLAGVGGAAIVALIAKELNGLAATSAASFPSGHATVSAALAASLVLLLWEHPRRRLIAAAGIGAVFLYGFMLVASVWHSPSEVVGGWLLALVWVSGIWLGARALLSAELRPPSATKQGRRPRWNSRQERGLEPRS